MEPGHVFSVGSPISDEWDGGFCTQLEIFGDVVGVGFALPNQRICTTDAVLFVRFCGAGHGSEFDLIKQVRI